MSQFIKNIKPIWEEKTAPVVDFLYKLNITPNFLTICGLILIFIGSYFIYLNYLFIAGIFILFGNIFDALDGYLARKYNQTSTFGAFLDSVIDRCSDVVPIFTLIYLYRDDDLFFLIGAVAIIGSFMTSYTRAKCEGLGYECKIGAFERPERSIFLIVGLLSGLVFYSILLIAIGSNFTAFQRIFYFYKESSKL